MFIKIHRTYRDVVAICDSDLIGKKLEEGRFQLNIKENFFKGEKISEEQAVKMIKKMSAEDATFNLVGEKSVSTALNVGVISEDGIKRIQGIPFAMVLL